MPREVDVRLLELGMRTGEVRGALARTRLQGRDVVPPARLSFRIPAEALHVALVLGQLDHRIGVVLGVVEIIDLVQVASLEGGVQHLGFHLVHGGECVVLRQEEQRRRASQGVKAPERAGGVEVSHHFGALDLVVAQGVFLRRDESVGHEPRAVGLAVLDDDIDAVGGVLPVAVAEHKRVPVQPDQGIQVIVSQGIAGHLHVFAEQFHPTVGPQEGKLRRVHGSRCRR